MIHTIRFMFFCALALPVIAQAGVYIAPMDEDGSIEYTEEPMYIEVDAKRVKSYLPKSSGERDRSDPNIPMINSDRISMKQAGSSNGEMSRGNGVPLRQAIQAVLPDDDWVVNFDGSVSPRQPAVWATKGDWQDILRDIADRNDVNIAVNEEEKVVGVSSDPAYARLLSAPNADVKGIREARQAGVPAGESQNVALKDGDMIWYISPDMTIRENLINWTTRNDWYVDWDYPKDYTLKAPAQFVGTFKEAAREFLYVLSEAGYPLGAEVNTRNKVIRIRGIK